jgi:hypothetical protein
VWMRTAQILLPHRLLSSLLRSLPNFERVKDCSFSFSFLLSFPSLSCSKALLNKRVCRSLKYYFSLIPFVYFHIDVFLLLGLIIVTRLWILIPSHSDHEYDCRSSFHQRAFTGQTLHWFDPPRWTTLGEKWLWQIHWFEHLGRGCHKVRTDHEVFEISVTQLCNPKRCRLRKLDCIARYNKHDRGNDLDWIIVDVIMYTAAENVVLAFFHCDQGM